MTRVERLLRTLERDEVFEPLQIVLVPLLILLTGVLVS